MCWSLAKPENGASSVDQCLLDLHFLVVSEKSIQSEKEGMGGSKDSKIAEIDSSPFFGFLSFSSTTPHSSVTVEKARDIRCPLSAVLRGLRVSITPLITAIGPKGVRVGAKAAPKCGHINLNVRSRIRGVETSGDICVCVDLQ
mgnify:CR=1 FL=1